MHIMVSKSVSEGSNVAYLQKHHNFLHVIISLRCKSSKSEK